MTFSSPHGSSVDASGPGVETPESPVEGPNPPVAAPGGPVEAPDPSGEPPGASVPTPNPSGDAPETPVPTPGGAGQAPDPSGEPPAASVSTPDPSGEPPGTPVVSTNALERWCELSSRTARRGWTCPRPSRHSSPHHLEPSPGWMAAVPGVFDPIRLGGPPTQQVTEDSGSGSVQWAGASMANDFIPRGDAEKWTLTCELLLDYPSVIRYIRTLSAARWDRSRLQPTRHARFSLGVSDSVVCRRRPFGAGATAWRGARRPSSSRRFDPIPGTVHTYVGVQFFFVRAKR
jgi:hypothetical protein